jgi:hypothetical protein
MTVAVLGFGDVVTAMRSPVGEGNTLAVLDMTGALIEYSRIGYTPGGVNYTLFPTYTKLARFDAGKVQCSFPRPVARVRLWTSTRSRPWPR